MLFQSFKFLVFFLVVFAVYWSLRRPRLRLAWLLLASGFFYASWNPWLLTLIVFSASVDYIVALWLVGMRVPWQRRLLLALSIGTNLGLLVFFKYTNFLLSTAATAGGLFGLSLSPPVLDLILPLGISFYTFETISYVVDVYQGRLPPVRHLLDYGLYILFFPHLVAGPIVRPRDFLPQVWRRKHFNWDRLQLGLQFFLLGLFKKVVLADNVAPVADAVFAAPTAYASSATWLAVVGYAAQIYCDFSGYSDMAIGLPHMLGFHLPANFDMPYFAGNITDFWRRWHISLSSWLRDYLYVPLGGNRHGRMMLYRNLLLTMLLGGLWHGASWTFAAWGLYHGLLLAAHRAVPRPRWLTTAWLRPAGVAVTFLAVCIGWVFFRAQTFADAGAILFRLAWPTGGRSLASTSAAAAGLVLAVVFAGHLLGTFVDRRRVDCWVPAPVLGAALACLLLLIQLLTSEDGKAFIYFQF